MNNLVRIGLRATTLSNSETRQVINALQQIVNEFGFEDDLGDRSEYLLSLSTYDYPDRPGKPGSSLLIGETYRLYADSPEDMVIEFRKYVEGDLHGSKNNL